MKKLSIVLILASICFCMMGCAGKDSVDNASSGSVDGGTDGSTGGEGVADGMDVSTEKDKSFYVMKVKDDYIEIPGECKFIYEQNQGVYPELEDGEIACMVADVKLYDGGEAGYMNNIFIETSKTVSKLDYSQAVSELGIPEAGSDVKIDYYNHMFQYTNDGTIYLIVLNRQYIDVYTKDGLYMEYEHKNDGDDFGPFFTELEKEDK